jgi:hypothetical protein
MPSENCYYADLDDHIREQEARSNSVFKQRTVEKMRKDFTGILSDEDLEYMFTSFLSESEG